MTDVVKTIVDSNLDLAINLVDTSLAGLIEVVNQGRGIVFDVAGSTTKLADTVTEDMIDELQELRAKVAARAQAIKTALVEPLSVLP